MSDAVSQIKHNLELVSDPVRADASAWYFKPDPGFEDIFLGVSVPKQRAIAKKYFKKCSPEEVLELLQSHIHEERLTALLIWVLQYKQGAKETKKKVYNLYLANTSWINNWDLVDTSARDIVGEYIYDKDQAVLTKLSESSDIWERRIAIIATSYFIQYDEFDWTLLLAEHYLNDTHHYIHKATGWMLREVGKRNASVLTAFLDAHASQMPRTMLRYAIEKFDTPTRQSYLAIKKSAVQ